MPTKYCKQRDWQAQRWWQNNRQWMFDRDEPWWQNNPLETPQQSWEHTGQSPIDRLSDDRNDRSRSRSQSNKAQSTGRGTIEATSPASSPRVHQTHVASGKAQMTRLWAIHCTTQKSIRIRSSQRRLHQHAHHTFIRHSPRCQAGKAHGADMIQHAQ